MLAYPDFIRSPPYINFQKRNWINWIERKVAVHTSSIIIYLNVKNELITDVKSVHRIAITKELPRHIIELMKNLTYV